jgi:hypothetical protein
MDMGGKRMSILRDVVFFMLIFQLAIQITNQIEIIPGIHLNTGQITPNLGTATILNGVVQTINYTQTAFKSINNVTCGSGVPCNVVYTLSFLNLINYNWQIDINQSFEIMGYDTGLPIGQLMNIVGFTLILLLTVINLVVGMFLLFIALIFDITIGAIPFYISIFSLIDPNLGFLLGTCLGGLQMVVIGWEILKICTILVSTLIAMI